MNRNELKAGVILTYINLLASNIISILYTPYILHSLGQAEYGVYTLVWSIVNYLTVLDLGFSNAIIRYASKYKAEKEEEKEAQLYGNFLIVYIVIALAAVILCGVIRLHFGAFAKGLTDTEVSIAMELIMIGSINIAISFPFSVFRGIVNVAERFIFIKILDLFRTLMTPVTTFVILFTGHGSVGLMWAYTLISIVVMLLYVYYTFAVLHQKFSFKLCEKGIVKELAGYSFYTFLGTIVDKIYWGTDQLILSNRKDSQTIAIYSIGSNFPNYFISFSTAISGVLLPRITKISSSEEKNKEHILSAWFIKIGRLQFWVLSLVLLGFIFLGQQFISIWAGNEYAQAYWIAIIIMIPSIISLSQNTGISIMQAKNKIRFRSVSYFFIALLNIVISLMLVDKYGGIGCAIGTTIGNIIGPVFLMNIYYQKVIHLDIKGYWKNVFSMLKAWILPTAAGIFIRLKCNVNSYITFLIYGVIFSFVFFASAYAAGFNEYEKALVKNMLSKIKRKTEHNGEKGNEKIN
jgi:O-antigen/teichoic acid export membrane protein